MREENEFFYSEEETLEIVQKYEDMLKHNRSFFFDVVDFENIIDYYLNSDNSQRASEAVDIAFNMHPHSSEIQMKKAELLIIDKQYEEALNILNVLVKIEPDNGELFFLKGQAHLALRDFNMAHEGFWHSTHCPTDDKVDLLYRIAGLYQDIDEPNFALRYLLYGFSLDRYSLNILFELGYCYERLGELNKSEHYYNLYLDQNAFSTSVWYNLGIVHTRKGEFAKALEAYDYALAVDPANASALHNQANTYATIEKYAEAAESFTELLTYEPENPRIFASIGECYEKLGNFDKAFETFKKCLELDALFPDAYFGMGIAYFKQDKLDQALTNIQRAIALEPENYDYWLGLAKVLFEMGSDKEAMDAYKEATTLNPDEVDAFIGIAELLLFEEHFAEVEELYMEVGEKFADYPALKILNAAAQYLQGKPSVALTLLRQAKKINLFAVEEFLAVVSVIDDPKFLNQLNSL